MAREREPAGEREDEAADAAKTRELDGEEREIGDVTYKSRPLDFVTGRKMLVRLMKIIGPIAAAAYKGAALDLQLGLKEAGPGTLSEVLMTLPAVLSEADLDYFATTFGANGYYLNSEGQWRTLRKTDKGDPQALHWAGKYLEHLRWLTFNLEVNFKDFFSGVASDKSGMGTLATMIGMGKKQPSPASNGGSDSSGD